jgi:pimeloyl-ACP methyl ester carboxylesterase
MAAAEDVDASATLAGRLGGLALGAGKTLGAVVGAGYIGVCALVYVFQRKLQYFPTKEAPPAVSSLPAVCRGIEDFSVRTEDGETIRGWYWAPLPGGKHADVTLLQLHGNAGSRHNRLYWAHHIRSRLGVGVALLDYRGYGGSTGRVTEKGMILDGVAGITWATTRAKETKSKLVLHLESIGSAAGVAAAA